MRISIIGAGKVGYFLGKAFHESGHSVVQVFNRSMVKAKQLGEKINAKAINRFDQLSLSVDLIVIAVKDDALPLIASQLPHSSPNSPLIVHTSGATPSSIFEGMLNRYGVFYPLQTFTKGRELNFRAIPFCIWAKSDSDLKLLRSLGKSLEANVFTISDEQRASIHVAAVLVNNFVNHLYTQAQSIAQQNNWPFEMLLPLIEETALKVQQFPPQQSQTGPAIRGDLKTIHNHLDLLKSDPSIQEIYRQLTQQINPSIKIK